MSGPILWIFMPLVFSFAALGMGKFFSASRWFLLGATFIFFLSTLIIKTHPPGALISEWSISSDLNILGRVFRISEEIRVLIAILYAFVILWELISLQKPQPNYMSALRLAGTTFLIASLSVRPILYAALFIEASVITFTLLLTFSSKGVLRGVRYLLVLSSLAMSLFLLIGWQLSGGNISPVDETQLQISVNVISLSFMLWMGIFPFNAWMQMISREHAEIDTTFFFTIFTTSMIFLLLQSLNLFSWFKQFPAVMPAIEALGIIMMVVNSIPLAVDPFNRERIANWSGFSLGIILLAISINTTDSMHIALILLLARNLCLCGLGDFFSRYSGTLDDNARFSLTTFDWIEYVISASTLAGIPITLTFPSVFLLSSILSVRNPIASIGFLLAVGFSWMAWGKIVRSISDIKNITDNSLRKSLSNILIGGIILVITIYPAIMVFISAKILVPFISGSV